MQLQSARDAKLEVLDVLGRLLAERAGPRAAPAPVLAGGSEPPGAGVAVGVSVGGDGRRFGVALRYTLGTPTSRMLVRRAAAAAADEVDVRRVGRIRPLVAPARPRVSSAQTERVRPLRPGLSIAHVDVTAGTLGAFVRRAGEEGAVWALSNNHVLAASGEGRVGDPVLQPGPADGGRDPDDRVGALSDVVPLVGDGINVVDAALARLDDPEVVLDYPAGRVAEVVAPEGGEEVEKVGRTTGVTRGRISAIELDDVVVGYPFGPARFDGQIEVTGGGGAFSRPGDSGSLVYRPDTRAAVGLLFAGSETGGDNGEGLTFCNPIGAALEALGVVLA